MSTAEAPLPPEEEVDRVIIDVDTVSDDDIAEQIKQIKGPEKFYSTNKVAELFEVTSETVRNWIEEGKLKAVKVNGLWRVPRDEVLRFANDRYKGGNEE